MHIHSIQEDGQTVEQFDLCSDACNRQFAGEGYAGWNGAHEAEFTTYCASCGVAIPGEDACEHQLTNVVVNRFLSDEGEKCEHGNWIQLPASYLGRL